MNSAAFTSRYDERAQVLHLRGDIDDRVLRQLDQTLRVLSSVDLTVDLSLVTYLPSGAVSRLLTAKETAVGANGSSLRLVAPRGSVAAAVLTVVAVNFDETSDPT